MSPKGMIFGPFTSFRALGSQRVIGEWKRERLNVWTFLTSIPPYVLHTQIRLLDLESTVLHLGRTRLFGDDRSQRQGDAKGASFPDLAFDPHVAVVQLDELLHDVEPEAR